jgi:pilus assembly protein CpaE
MIVLVITQEIAAIKSMRSFLEMWDGIGMKRERLALVVNKYRKTAAITPRKISETLNMPIELTIPEDFDAAMRAANLGNPLLMSNPNADVSQAIVELAEKLKQKLPSVQTQERFRLYLKNS